MRPDDVSLVAKKDELICAFGARYLKIHKEEHFVNVTSRKMRELARLVIAIRNMNPQLTSLIKILKPKNFDILLEATKTVARFDKNHDTFNSPTYAMNIATSLKQCCDIAIMENLKRKYVNVSVSTAEIESDLKTLIHLINANWKFEISSQAGNDLNVNKWNKISIIPLAQDLKTLKEYLIKIGNRAASNINQSSGTHKDFQNLIESVYCRVILSNRRRPGELQRLLLHTYETFATSDNQNYEEFEETVTPTEKNLMRTFKRVVIRRKRGRGVPILFSRDVQEHIGYIIRYRTNFCKTENPYLFSNVNSSNEISGYKVLQKHAKLCGAKHPEGITCTKLRKHLATLSQVFNMSETDLEQLATFMGHTIGIHRQSYRLPDDVYQTSKIAKILLLLEKGDVGQFKGKTLDEIDVQMNECLIKENQSNLNGEQELLKEGPEPLDDVNEVAMVREKK
ncbi:hypothetical protein RN001_005645 [Aquatica leii]|uniref:Uncharacterized protein n=1 Tax=Aquatica leii TaxID=1421715 RepID=A0AAN7PHB1_9COLE|nr:hypothetical protein RN001_005645 [Aquatica leii]